MMIMCERLAARGRVTDGLTAKLKPVPGRPKSLERFDRARALRAHAHVYKYTHAHWSTTTGPYHYGSAQDTIYPTGSGLYCFCPRAALA